MSIPLYAVLIPFLLLLAGIFAAGEAALFALTRPQLEQLRKARPHAYRRVRDLIGSPEVLLSTVVLGNEMLSITVGTLVTALVGDTVGYFDYRAVAILSVLLSAALLLTFSEVLPKLLAFRYAVVTASVLVYPLYAVYWVMTPARKVFLWVSRGLLKLFGIEPAPPVALGEQDLLTLVEVSAEAGTLERTETELIHNVFAFGDMTVASVMTPWDKVFRIRDQLTVDEALPVVRRAGFSRIPVVAEPADNVVGVLYAKELLKMTLRSHQAAPEERTVRIAEAVFSPYIVSSHKKIARLFREFKQKKVHFALVVDEYGRHTGVITLEDLLSALLNAKGRDRRENRRPPALRDGGNR